MLHNNPYKSLKSSNLKFSDFDHIKLKNQIE